MSEPPEAAAGARAALKATAERWSLPTVEGPLAGATREARRSPAADVTAREEGVRGYEAGMARARAQMQAQLLELEGRIRQLDAVLRHLAQPLRALDAQVEQELLALALAVGEQLARRELRADPAQLIAILRLCLEQLPSAAREIRVHLHPDDAAVVRAQLTAPAGQHAWSLIDDPTLGRGGCLVRSDSSQIDARFESRVNAIIANALGDPRALPRATEAAAEVVSADGSHERR